ncbi:hypothetical protein D5301_05600 [Stenotrophomonas sp. MH181796]|uniref:hypothetical protein n=1 Tax=Stenotrophomonas sp. MH181796 TaxID=2339228 RepID=UPI00129CF803|nr:hypothetical protein [Stenotrophomonas sp. MH181796]MRI41717.1 hypothetical protein [Stenotrophomonas sp. MH181796]
MKRLIGGVLIFALSLQYAHALDVEGYKVFKDAVKHGKEPFASHAGSALNGYFQAMAEVLTLQRSGDSNYPIPVASGVFICMPKSVPVTTALIEAAANQEINENASTYNKDKGWVEVGVSTYALLGMARMFPCSS